MVYRSLGKREYLGIHHNYHFLHYYLHFYLFCDVIIDDEIIQLYENATRQSPGNEELGNHWFMALVRNNDFKGQQQVIRYL